MKLIHLSMAALAAALPVSRLPTRRRPRRPAAQSPSQALAALFAASDEANLQRNPLGALAAATRATPTGSATFRASLLPAEREAARSELAALARSTARR